MQNNKKRGNKFEVEFCEMLDKEGIWSHNFQQNHTGQPVDVIVVGDKGTCLVDCKLCSKNVFKFSRIEDNQDLSMDKFSRLTGHSAWFALKTEDEEVTMISKRLIDLLRKEKKQLNRTEIESHGLTVSDWLKVVRS